jgi:hypothetical protein
MTDPATRAGCSARRHVLDPQQLDDFDCHNQLLIEIQIDHMCHCPDEIKM